MVCKNDPVINEINTATCETHDCGTIPTVVSPCSVTNCSCGCSPCQCMSASPASPTSFINQACEIQEDHKEIFNTQTFITAVATANAFNMPIVGGVIGGVVIPGLQVLQVGSWLWNVTYGYLLVTSFDVGTMTVALENPGYAGNAAAGTLIPACTMFNVVDPPFITDTECGGDYSYLTQNFTVPLIGSSVNISVSNLLGILVSRNVQIGTGSYLVTAIIDNLTITIKNNGLGGIPGTTVYAKDTLGHCISPVTPYSDDPCVNTIADEGALLVCHSGLSTILNATQVGQIPVCTDAVNNIVEFQSPEYPTIECTYLTSCLTLVSGTLTYTLVVADSSSFAVGDLVLIDDPNVTGYQWVVTSVPDATHIVVESVSGVQSLDITIAVDVPVCHAPCCEQIQYQLDNYDVQLGADESGDEYTTIVPATAFHSSTRSSVISNTTDKNMDILVFVNYVFEGRVDVQNACFTQIRFSPWFQYAIAAIGVVPVIVQYAMRNLRDTRTWGTNSWGINWNYLANINKSYVHTVAYTLAPGYSLHINAHLEIGYEQFTNPTPPAAPVATGYITVDGISTQIHILGVAL